MTSGFRNRWKCRKVCEPGVYTSIRKGNGFSLRVIDSYLSSSCSLPSGTHSVLPDGQGQGRTVRLRMLATGELLGGASLLGDK